ncbi:hypothetical protein Anas_14268 [Armadillidium nasatum]|uniref:Uncharacterized protein n=1 Tax=Armadillidium nasatum TaxID=96803 RepID=A0A5N5T060_9CRUS|nr:hypothetical protein Anas_14268 [Armadillidium nasatum]
MAGLGRLQYPLNKDGEAFSRWLKEDIGMRRKCDIESCLNDIKTLEVSRVQTPQIRRDLENRQDIVGPEKDI